MNDDLKEISVWLGHPLRVMQVHSLYPIYLPWYYKKFPKVKNADFEIQTKALLKHGLFALHMLTEELHRNGCNTSMVFANAKPLQYKWAEDNKIDNIDEQNWEIQILDAQINKFRPDVLYFSDNHDFPSRLLQKLTYKPLVVCGWRCAPVDLSTDWSSYDIIFSMLDRILLLAPLLGANSAKYMNCGYPQWLGEKIDNVEHDVDVTFYGTYSTRFAPHVHAHRRKILDSLMDAATKKLFSINLGFCDGAEKVDQRFRPFLRELAYGVDMQIATKRGRMTPDIQGWVSATLNGQSILRLTGGETATMRLFEAVGGGSLTFTEERARLNKFFTPEKEVITYKNTDDLVNKIIFYKNHQDLHKIVADAGKKTCREKFSKKNQVKTFIQSVKEVIHKKITNNYKHTAVHLACSNKTIPEDKFSQKLLKILMTCSATDEGLQQALPVDHELFRIACKMVYAGEIERAIELDTSIMKSAAIAYDIGNISIM